MIRVAIIEDQRSYREALAMVLERTSDMALLGVFASVDDLEQAVRLDPARVKDWDVVLMDLELPGRDGVAGMKLLRSVRPDVRVVMCTVYEDAPTVRRAIQQGADGYLVKRTPLPELLAQVRKAGGGDSPLSAEVASTLLELVRAPSIDERCEVAVDGSSIVTRNGDRVDLRRRRNVRLLLAALARQRRDHPGQALSAEDCLQAAWPDESIQPQAARSRLWTSVRSLRSMGLGEELETFGGGYRLAEVVRVVRV